jgi:ABC-type amino acid transport system permease subunit
MRLLRLVSFPVRYWNWKAALFSVSIRSLTYLFASSRHGLGSGVRAALVEALYVALTAGFFSALQQGALKLRPRAMATLTVVLGVPLLAQLCDYSLQHAAGTPNAKSTSIGLTCWALVSAAFHLHLMRNGAMIVGEEARSLGHDMKRVPKLVISFVVAPFKAAIQLMSTRQPAAPEAAADELAA